MGRGPMVSVFSEDGGASWSPGAPPGQVEGRAGQAFVDVAADRMGYFHVIWLGRRDRAEGPKGLYAAQSTDGGQSWQAPDEIDPETCECCWNRLVVAEDGALFALYRDLDPRDMAVARKGPDGWTRLGRAGPFDWDFQGCPHVGGGIVPAMNGSLHTLVWTGKEMDTGLYYIRSFDRGASWEQPRPMGGESAMRGDLVGTRRGMLAAVWDTQELEASAVFGETSDDSGDTWTAPVQLSSEGAKAGHPFLVRVGQDLRAFWFEGAEADEQLLMTTLLGAR